MTTKDLIPLLIIPNNKAKEKIENLLERAYIGIQNLKKMSLDKNLTIEYIEEIEGLFIENQFSPDNLVLPKYLKKYAILLSNFWESYVYYNRRISRGKFHLFNSLKENDFKLKKSYSDEECTEVIRKMENYWIASNQIYTQYQIYSIRNKSQIMTTKDLTPLLITSNNEIKKSIEILLEKAYINIFELKLKSSKGILSANDIDKVETFFLENSILEINNIPKSLTKYIKYIQAFFQAYIVKDPRKSIQNEINIFETLKTYDLFLKGYSEYEISVMLRNMENYWIASNQVYTQYQIYLIKKIY